MSPRAAVTVGISAYAGHAAVAETKGEPGAKHSRLEKAYEAEGIKDLEDALEGSKIGLREDPVVRQEASHATTPWLADGVLVRKKRAWLRTTGTKGGWAGG